MYGLSNLSSKHCTDLDKEPSTVLWTDPHPFSDKQNSNLLMHIVDCLWSPPSSSVTFSPKGNNTPHNHPLSSVCPDLKSGFVQF